MKKKQVSVAPSGEVHFYCEHCANPLNSKQQNYFIHIHEVGGKFRLRAANVISIKPDGNYSVFQFFDEHKAGIPRTVICRRTLLSWQYLSCIGLQRVRDNCIVNLTKVYYVGNNGLVKFHGQEENEIYITPKFEAEVEKALNEWNPFLGK